MDANGLRFWQVAEESQWTLVGTPSDADYDKERRLLHLASVRAPLAESGVDTAREARARLRLDGVAQTSDDFGTRAWLDIKTSTIRATGIAGGEVSIFTCADTQVVSDIAVGFDGVLYMAIDGRVVMHDLRNRWKRAVLADDALVAWRLAPCTAGGVWVLDRVNHALWRVLGMPFPSRPFAPYSPETVRPCSENPDSPRVVKQSAAVWPESAAPIAIAASKEGRVALMTWDVEGNASVRLLGREGWFGSAGSLAGARYAYDITWVDPGSVAVLVQDVDQEALVYKIVTETRATGDVVPELCRPMGDFYPLRDHAGSPFVNGVTYPAQYVAPALEPEEGEPAKAATDVAPLHAISQPTLAVRGVARCRTPIDSATAQTIWHRLYIEACIPPRTAIQLFLAATDSAAAPEDEQDWHEHRVGTTLRTERGRELPTAAWAPFASELPFHNGLLPCERERDRSGLFTVLIQRSNRPVRTLRGRYLWIRAVLHGDGRASPEIAAVRAYGSRLSYRDRYLPELYRESEVGKEADVPIEPTRRFQSTPADFLERFLDNFEGTLTLLEDRIANAHLLTNPWTVPEESLEWLAGWLGIAFDPAFPAERRRAVLAAASDLAKEHGTLRGLTHALDVVTRDACRRGEIVVLEDFRLRRTFSTILGINMSKETDPLLGGISDSGNSYVGDTLFVGDEQRKEFLALFAESLPTTRAKEAAVDAFFEKLAHRVTVLVHQNIDPQDLGLIRRVVELETPAHVETRVVPTTRPLLIGASSLIGVDTYLAPRVGRQPIVVNKSAIGARDFLLRPASLDPRLGGGSVSTQTDTLRPPTASVSVDGPVPFGSSFTLDGSESTPKEEDVDAYRWTRLN
jgi:phage tail-like protein